MLTPERKQFMTKICISKASFSISSFSAAEVKPFDIVRR